MNGPSPETLTKLRPQTERLLREATDRCPQGGRKLICEKIGGWSARRVVHWVETGAYPSDPIKPWCRDKLCVDCGRPGFKQPPAPVVEPTQVIAPPPPIPAAPPLPVVDVEPVERVEPVRQRPPLGAAVHGAPPSFQPGSSVRSTVPRWVRTAGVWAAGLVACFFVCAVLVQGVAVGVSKVRFVLPDVHVELPSTTTVDGSEGTPGG